VREWARAWLVRWRARAGADYGEEIATLNRLLARDTQSRVLMAARQGFEMVESPRIETAGALIALVAEQLAALIAEEDHALVKECSGPGCTLWFLDRTKAHRRMFCSASACGNRAKVAAFRDRQRR
jgi:predicted RNA-binding Zn ribbon-like protein